MNVYPLVRRHAYVLMAALAPTLLAGATESLESVRKLGQDWIAIRAETVRLQAAWVSERAILESTLTGLNERATQLEEKRELTLAQTAKEREELDSLKSKRKAAAEDLDVVSGRLGAFADRLIKVRPTLPPRLSGALEMSFRTLADGSLSVGERMQAATTILNRCAQFNGLVSSGEEVLTIDDASGARSLEVIYWGLSHGYALDRPLKKAWLGSPGPTGWKWEPRPEAVQPLTELIAIYDDKADPSFIEVPAKLEHVLTNAGNK